MTGKDMFMMGQEDRKRLHIIRKIMDQEMTQVEGGKAIGMSDRQIRRLIRRIETDGDKGICHQGRGRRSNRQIKEKTKQKVLALCRQKYEGFGPTLAKEKLLERDAIQISEETLRLWFKEAEIPYKTRRKRPHRQWRERRAHFGSLLQIDGSHHAWFEARGPKCVLMAGIDDATGRAYGRFYAYEGTLPAMESFKAYVLQYGLPLAVYVDRHSTYKSRSEPTVEEQLEGIESMSQFERGLKELGVRVIHAYSAPAKGRIERLFGTLQDRLVKEMRLAGVSTIKEGNRFLETYWPIHKKRFAVAPREAADIHRPSPGMAEINKALCIKESRALRNDFTITYHKTIYQVKENIRAKKVMVEERLDGSIHLTNQGKSLRYEEVSYIERPIVKEKTFIKTTKIRTKNQKPSSNHIWRQYKKTEIKKERQVQRQKTGHF